MDYNKICEDMVNNQPLPFFKPEPGTYKCIITKEPEEKLKTFKQGTADEEHKKILSIQMEANQEPVQWDIGVGKGFGSAYGQLMLLGKKYGKLLGAPFTLIVKRSGQGDKAKNDYSVLEALELINQQNQNSNV